MADDNLARLIQAATLLRPVLGELVFVGGTTAGLLITDPGAGETRATVDVDAIVNAKSYLEHTAFEERLRELGFRPDERAGAPLCRWVQGETVLDVMPVNRDVLGFSNRWYQRAVDTAEGRLLLEDLEIRIVTAPLFVATKLEAFKGRGRGDHLGSHDLGDVVALVDGRDTLAVESRGEQEDLRVFLRDEIRRLLANPDFIDALPGFLLPDSASQSRMILILERLNELANLPVRMNAYEQLVSRLESERVLLRAHQLRLRSGYLKRQCELALNTIDDAEQMLEGARGNSSARLLVQTFLKSATKIRKQITRYGYNAIAVPDDLDADGSNTGR